MFKRTVFTTLTPLPPDITREVAIEFLHNHLEMIDLNPLVTERHPIAVPNHAAPEEASCVWYSLTDKISYLPGDRIAGSVSYTCAFHNLPTGLQTHCYAPMGLDIRDKWTVAGRLPGEPAEPVELGLGAPAVGLYIREDVDMRCNIFMTSFVKKTLKKAHATLVDALKRKAQIVTSAVSASATATTPILGAEAGEKAMWSSQPQQHQIQNPHLPQYQQQQPPLDYYKLERGDTFSTFRSTATTATTSSPPPYPGHLQQTRTSPAPQPGSGPGAYERPQSFRAYSPYRDPGVGQDRGPSPLPQGDAGATDPRLRPSEMVDSKTGQMVAPLAPGSRGFLAELE